MCVCAHMGVYVCVCTYVQYTHMYTCTEFAAFQYQLSITYGASQRHSWNMEAMVTIASYDAIGHLWSPSPSEPIAWHCK